MRTCQEFVAPTKRCGKPAVVSELPGGITRESVRRVRQAALHEGTAQAAPFHHIRPTRGDALMGYRVADRVLLAGH
jgi:hypothetical protein